MQIFFFTYENAYLDQEQYISSQLQVLFTLIIFFWLLVAIIKAKKKGIIVFYALQKIQCDLSFERCTNKKKMFVRLSVWPRWLGKSSKVQV